MKHTPIRIRHDARRRVLHVGALEWITPRMLRVWLEGPDLSDFKSSSPDDHVKVFVPDADGQIARRDYTPRRFDARGGRLAIDFAMHDAGPVTRWARSAKVGDTLEIGGPRGSLVVPDDFDWWLLVGDETALPAIGRRIEEFPAGVKVTSLVAVSGPDEEQAFASAAEHRALWVHRAPERAEDAVPVLEALREIELPPGEGFVWIATEASVARAARKLVTDELRHPAHWLKASGYWARGQADASEKLIE